MVLARLERVSADSALAHRASGLRGALLKTLERDAEQDPGARDMILASAFQILEQEAGRYSARFIGLSGSGTRPSIPKATDVGDRPGGYPQPSSLVQPIPAAQRREILEPQRAQGHDPGRGV